MLLAIFGFLAPFLPEVLKLLNRHLDYKQELKMLELRMQYAKQEHSMRLEEIGARADIAEATLLHAPQKSWGVKLLDAAHDSGWPKWSLMIPFYLFTILDFVSGFVRPGVTYAVVIFYIAYKYARFDLMASVAKDISWAEKITGLWDTNDYNLLIMVLAYWFGNRVAKYAFGQDKR